MGAYYPFSVLMAEYLRHIDYPDMERTDQVENGSPTSTCLSPIMDNLPGMRHCPQNDALKRDIPRDIQEYRQHIHTTLGVEDSIKGYVSMGEVVISTLEPLQLDSLVAIACYSVMPNLGIDFGTTKKLQEVGTFLNTHFKSWHPLGIRYDPIERKSYPFQSHGFDDQSWDPATGQAPGTMPKCWLRAAMICYVDQVLQGRAFSRLETLHNITHLLQKDITPRVPIVETGERLRRRNPMDYVVALLEGEEDITVQLGKEHSFKLLPCREALKSAGLSPLKLGDFEAHMITTSSAFHIGVAAINTYRVDQAVYISQLLTAYTLEIAEEPGKYYESDPEQSTTIHEIQANMRALVNASAQVHRRNRVLQVGGEDSGVLLNARSQLRSKVLEAFDTKLSLVMEDHALARQQITSMLSCGSDNARQDLEKLAGLVIANEEALVDIFGDATSDTKRSRGGFSVDSTSSDESSAGRSDDNAASTERYGSVLVATTPENLAAQMLERMRTRTRANIYTLQAASSKIREVVSALLWVSHDLIVCLVDGNKNSTTLPSGLGYDGGGSSPTVANCVRESLDIICMADDLLTAIRKHEWQARIASSQPLLKEDEGAELIHLATHTLVGTGKIVRLLPRALAAQTYVLTHAADLRHILDDCLLGPFESIVRNSLPLLGRGIYATLRSLGRMPGLQSALYGAMAASWRSTAREKPAPCLADRMRRAVDAAVPDLILCLGDYGLSETSGTFSRWRENLTDRIVHWAEYWPKVLTVEPHKRMGAGGQGLYKLVRQSAAVGFDSSGKLPESAFPRWERNQTLPAGGSLQRGDGTDADAEILHETPGTARGLSDPLDRILDRILEVICNGEMSSLVLDILRADINRDTKGKSRESDEFLSILEYEKYSSAMEPDDILCAGTAGPYSLTNTHEENHDGHTHTSLDVTPSSAPSSASAEDSHKKPRALPPTPRSAPVLSIQIPGNGTVSPLELDQPNPFGTLPLRSRDDSESALSPVITVSGPGRGFTAASDVLNLTNRSLARSNLTSHTIPNEPESGSNAASEPTVTSELDGAHPVPE
ncbi:hypothetical protein BX600DRAFT_539582 [Xylariales sp. PMI_506]|nr:hypothetical protein BX600DRAFT_539582 [Xylariales sp. PMI_506]